MPILGEVHGNVDNSQRSIRRPCSHSTLASTLRRTATCSFFLLYTIFLGENTAAVINPSCSFCIDRETKILIFCLGPWGHPGISSFPDWSSLCCPCREAWKPPLPLAQLVSLAPKCPPQSCPRACPSDTEWTVVISHLSYYLIVTSDDDDDGVCVCVCACVLMLFLLWLFFRWVLKNPMALMSTSITVPGGASVSLKGYLKVDCNLSAYIQQI